MKFVAVLVAMAMLSGCASTKKEELTKDEQIAYLQYVIEHQKQNAQAIDGVPEIQSQQLVERVCISTPIYNMYGNYVRTSVKCK